MPTSAHRGMTTATTSGSVLEPDVTGGRRVWSLIAVETLVALSAVYGGVGLIWNNVIGMPDDWLQGTPFTSWAVPGAFLLLVVAVPMGVAAVMEVSTSPWAGLASIMAGAAQVGWIGAELFVMQRYNVLQPVMLAFGLVIMLVAVWSGRHRAMFPHRMVQRRKTNGQLARRCESHADRSAGYGLVGVAGIGVVNGAIHRSVGDLRAHQLSGLTFACFMRRTWSRLTAAGQSGPPGKRSDRGGLGRRSHRLRRIGVGMTWPRPAGALRLPNCYRNCGDGRRWRSRSTASTSLHRKAKTCSAAAPPKQ